MSVRRAPRIHYTRDWRRVVCNSRLGCDGRPVVSDPRLLAGPPDLACCNCSRMLTAEERELRDAKARELAELYGRAAAAGGPR